MPDVPAKLANKPHMINGRGVRSSQLASWGESANHRSSGPSIGGAARRSCSRVAARDNPRAESPAEVWNGFVLQVRKPHVFH